MSFLFPSFLIALFAVLVPVIIHLFNFRRFKKVYFTNVRFLKEIKQETDSRSKIKHWLVLLCRILAFCFLVFAFAQPFIPVADNDTNPGTRAVSIYIDNSFSMNAGDGEMPLLERAKRISKEIINTYNEDDRFQILTNDFEGRHQRMINRDEFLGFIDELEVSPSVKKISEIVLRQKEALQKETAESKVIYILSDFQKEITDFEGDTSLNINFVPIQSSEQKNVFIDSVWFEVPVHLINQPTQLVVKIRNTGKDAVENLRMSLKLNDEVKAISDVSIEPENFAYDSIHFTVNQNGWNKGELSIEDYPITFDDNYFFTFEVAEIVNVLVINEQSGNGYLKTLFENDVLFNYNEQYVGGIDYAQLENNQLIIVENLTSIPSGLASSLTSFTEKGGALLVFPGEKIDIENYNLLLSALDANLISDRLESRRKVEKINTEQDIFKGVFEEIQENINLPDCRLNYRFSSRATSREEQLLSFSDGTSFVSRYGFGAGDFYLCATPLDIDYSNFPVHAIFVPMIYKMAIFGSKSDHIAYTISSDTKIKVRDAGSSQEMVYKIRGNELEFIPQQNSIGSKIYLGLQDQVKKSGIYEVFRDEGSSLWKIALNFDRKESVMSVYESEELESRYAGTGVTVIASLEENVSQVINELSKGVVLWKLCLILALIFFAAEILLIRFLPS